MSSLYRNALPQLDGGFFLSDGGIETSLIFNDGLELPDFAAFHLFSRPGGDAALRNYFHAYARIAERFGTGLVLESATWRASLDWGVRLGYSPRDMGSVNRLAIRLLDDLRASFPRLSTVISGCVGPRGDGYQPARMMSAEEARDYHRAQIETFAGTSADMVSAITMNYVEEALGIANSARDFGMPVAVSFTVETDGRLPTGQSLQAAIEEVDGATAYAPAYYMINCAHPEHLAPALNHTGSWQARVRGLRANASRRSHSELDESTDLDAGDPTELAHAYRELRDVFPELAVVGGCCGTDDRHVAAIGRAMEAAA